jgi:hypothetical protein
MPLVHSLFDKCQRLTSSQPQIKSTISEVVLLVSDCLTISSFFLSSETPTATDQVASDHVTELTKLREEVKLLDVVITA